MQKRYSDVLQASKREPFKALAFIIEGTSNTSTFLMFLLTTAFTLSKGERISDHCSVQRRLSVRPTDKHRRAHQLIQLNSENARNVILVTKSELIDVNDLRFLYFPSDPVLISHLFPFKLEF